MEGADRSHCLCCFLTFGAGYEWKAPTAATAFAAPEINNDFVTNLKNERILSTELTYSYQTSWVKLNLNGYYSLIDNASEWQNFYYDDINSFSYVSLTDQQKAHQLWMYCSWVR